MARFTRRVVGWILLIVGSPAAADGPADRLPDQVRRIPPPGIAVPESDRQQLEAGLARLANLLAASTDRHADLVADVEVFHKAIRDALKHDEFFAAADVLKAKRLLQEGLARAEALKVGQAPWTSRRGPVGRGYRSRIDGTVQPYGVVVPESYRDDGTRRYRLDVWFHGRSETLSEVNFLDDRERNAGQFTPAETIVLHPYGRYCNAFKFAGEVDVFEAIAAVKRQYRIDDERISVRGFSMGGAACWHFAVHHADRWFAAAPGAGFAETPRYLNVFQNETPAPSWYETKLWRLYDCDLWALNLRHCPTVAYSGELDRQKQAADVMEEALKPLGVKLVHVIGPQTKHAYHPSSKAEIDRRLDALASRGRERDPRVVDFVTYTLKYNRMHWVVVDTLGEHWEPATVHAVASREPGRPRVEVTTQNVEGLTLEIAPGSNLLGSHGQPSVIIDGQTVEAPLVGSDRSWRLSAARRDGRWATADQSAPGLRKRHGLQGPIDDAFMDAFVFVTPTGTARHPAVQRWVAVEQSRAIEHWRRQFRGQPRVVEDRAITDEQVAEMNLVLWGDPQSNLILKRIADRLPIVWGAESIRVGDRTFPADEHAVILVYPNPLNPSRYVVLNSGFTFREYDYLTNARQVPKLPDWAIVDLKTPPNSRHPGRIAAADFFDERWALKPSKD